MMQDSNAQLQNTNDQAKIFSTFHQLNFGELHFKQDLKHHFFAIVAIHSTARGPSLGGCRFIPYPKPEAAVIDVMRLAHSMSYKAAISNLALGGGKAVIIHNPLMTDRVKVFELFGEFIESLGGRYITSEDSGTHVEDMDVVAKKTSFVTGHSKLNFAIKDPSPLTSLGVVKGMEACAKFKLKRDSLEGLHVVVQGVGNVGLGVVEQCAKQGAKVTICDTNQTIVEDVIARLSVEKCHIDEVYDIPCDIFSPCALSNSINENTLARFKTKIIAGAANNQLAAVEFAASLKEKGILYAPDYVINAGGVIHVCAQYYQESELQAEEKVLNIYNTLLDIFERSEANNQTTLEVANQIAESRLQ